MEFNRAFFQNLLTTNYISNENEDSIERTRAGSTIPASSRGEEDAIEIHNTAHDVILCEDECNQIHQIEETPKLIVKKAKVSKRTENEAAIIMRKLKTTPANVLNSERYDYYTKKMFHSTRESELEVFSYVLSNPNSRPAFFSMQSEHLNLNDIQTLFKISLQVPPKNSGQNLVRLPIKPSNEFHFQQIVEILDNISNENNDFELTEANVYATLTDNSLEKRGHRLKTTNYREYAEIEEKLENPYKLITSRAFLTCSLKGKKHVELQIGYFNNATKVDDIFRRKRFIEIEQTVKCINRRVTIDEDRNNSFEFEVDNEMTPLVFGIPPVNDLITYLHTGELDVENQ